jgi:hypothetical protein
VSNDPPTQLTAPRQAARLTVLLDALCGLAVCRSPEGKWRFMTWLADFDLSTARRAWWH